MAHGSDVMENGREGSLKNWFLHQDCEASMSCLKQLIWNSVVLRYTASA